MRSYRGVRRGRRVAVLAGGRPLERRLDLEEQLARDFDWGANLKGTKRLALSILLNYFSSLEDGELVFYGKDRQLFVDDKALAAYEAFAVEVLEPIATDRWVMFDFEIKAWLAGEELHASDLEVAAEQ